MVSLTVNVARAGARGAQGCYGGTKETMKEE